MSKFSYIFVLFQRKRSYEFVSLNCLSVCLINTSVHVYLSIKWAMSQQKLGASKAYAFKVKKVIIMLFLFP